MCWILKLLCYANVFIAILYISSWNSCSIWSGQFKFIVKWHLFLNSEFWPWYSIQKTMSFKILFYSKISLSNLIKAGVYCTAFLCFTFQEHSNMNAICGTRSVYLNRDVWQIALWYAEYKTAVENVKSDLRGALTVTTSN